MNNHQARGHSRRNQGYLLSILLTMVMAISAFSVPSFAGLRCEEIFSLQVHKTNLPEEGVAPAEIFTNRYGLIEILREKGIIESNVRSSAFLSIAELNLLVIKLLENKNIQFTKTEDQIEILATIDGAPLNRYLFRLKNVFKVNPKFYLKIDLPVVGGFDRDSRNIYFGVETLAYFMTKNGTRNLSGIVPHELIHAISRQFLFDRSISEREEVDPRSPYAFSVEANFLASGYQKSIDVAEIIAQVLSAEYTLKQIMKEIRSGTSLSDSKIKFLVSFFSGISFNLQSIQRTHIQGHYEKLNSKGTVFYREISARDVMILDAKEFQSVSKDITSESFINEVKTKAAYGISTRIVLIADRSSQTSTLVILDRSNPVYLTKAPSHLDQQQILTWIKKHIDDRYITIEKAKSLISQTSRELVLASESASAVSNETYEKLRTALTAIRALRKSQWHPVPTLKYALPNIDEINGVVGLEMAMDIGTATHLGNGLFVTAAHNLAGRKDSFRPNKYYFENVSVMSFDRMEPLTNHSVSNLTSRYFPKGAMISYSNMARVSQSAAPAADIAIFKAPLAEGQAKVSLGRYTLKKTAYSGGVLYAVVTGLHGPRIVSAMFEQAAIIHSGYRLLVVKTSEPLAPGDSGSPLFEINPQTGQAEIVGILHGVGQDSGKAYFVEISSALKNAFDQSGLSEGALTEANGFEVWRH